MQFSEIELPSNPVDPISYLLKHDEMSVKNICDYNIATVIGYIDVLNFI